MALVSAKCTACGAAIVVDDCLESGVCEFCGTQFLTQKVISHTTVVKHITQNVLALDGRAAEEFIENGEVLIKLGEFDKACGAFEQATKLAPADYRCWLGLSKAHTENWDDVFNTTHIEFLQKAKAVASKEDLQIIEQEVQEFSSKRQQKAEAELVNYADAVGKANASYRALKKVKAVFIISLVLFVTFVFTFLAFVYGVKLERAEKKFYDLLFDVILLERLFRASNVVFEVQPKAWSDDALRKKKVGKIYDETLKQHTAREHIKKTVKQSSMLQ